MAHHEQDDFIQSEHQGSRRLELTHGLDQAERRKQGPDNINLPVFVGDNVGYHITQIIERKQRLLVELNELNTLLIKLQTLSDVTGLP